MKFAVLIVFRKLLEVIGEFSKVARYKTNIHKNQLHFCTLTVNNPKRRLKNKPNQRGDRLYTENYTLL